jgi:hypothetical protein
MNPDRNIRAESPERGSKTTTLIARLGVLLGRGDRRTPASTASWRACASAPFDSSRAPLAADRIEPANARDRSTTPTG